MISGVSSQHLIGHEIIVRKMKDNKYILSSSKKKKKEKNVILNSHSHFKSSHILSKLIERN